MKEELWKEIPSFPGFLASNHGRIKNGKNNRIHTQWLNGTEGRVRYWRVRVASYNILVHRLVCEAFHGSPPFQGALCAHNDGDGLNNDPANLRWATARQNSNDKIRHGTHNRGERSPRTKLTNKQVLNAYQRMMDGESSIKIAAEIGVSKTTLAGIRSGISWSWLTGADNPRYAPAPEKDVSLYSSFELFNNWHRKTHPPLRFRANDYGSPRGTR